MAAIGDGGCTLVGLPSQVLQWAHTGFRAVLEIIGQDDREGTSLPSSLDMIGRKQTHIAEIDAFSASCDLAGWPVWRLRRGRAA